MRFQARSSVDFVTIRQEQASATQTLQVRLCCRVRVYHPPRTLYKLIPARIHILVSLVMSHTLGHYPMTSEQRDCLTSNKMSAELDFAPLGCSLNSMFIAESASLEIGVPVAFTGQLCYTTGRMMHGSQRRLHVMVEKTLAKHCRIPRVKTPTVQNQGMQWPHPPSPCAASAPAAGVRRAALSRCLQCYEQGSASL